MSGVLSTDICVIGGGPGGIAAAITAADHGVPVILVEKAVPGGADLTRGAVPSKALVAAAASREALRLAPAMGVTAASLQVDFAGVRDHIRHVAGAVAPNVSKARLEALGITVVTAAARFTDSSHVTAGDVVIRARRFVIATGALPAVPALPGLDTVTPLTLDTAFDLDRAPRHLVIVGAGAHGLELAQAYVRLGVLVTVVDREPALAETDRELAIAVLDRLTAEGVTIRAEADIKAVARHEDGVRVRFADIDGDHVVDGSHLLLASGRRPDIAELGLDAAGVAFDPSGIVVDRRYRTSNRRVYAVGDVVAGPGRADRAAYEAERVVRQILYRRPVGIDPSTVPAVTFTDPALATVGLSEAEAIGRYRGVRILRLPFVENVLAEAERAPFGMVKIVTSRRGRILGAGIVGRNAGELIAVWSLALANRLGIDAMLSWVPPHPSRAEASRRVAASFHGAGMMPVWRRRIVEFLRKFG